MKIKETLFVSSDYIEAVGRLCYSAQFCIDNIKLDSPVEIRVMENLKKSLEHIRNCQ